MAYIYMATVVGRFGANCRNTGMGKIVIRGELGYAHWPQLGSQIHCPIRSKIWGPLRQTDTKIGAR